MFQIEMLAARQGDALWIEYGDRARPHRILYDGGTPGSWAALRERIELLPERDRGFELLIVSHIDLDHIGGVLSLLEDDSLGVEFEDVWFNGFRHLPGPLEEMGPIEGERLTTLLLRNRQNWNLTFEGQAVCVNSDGSLPMTTLPGGMKLTILSPRASELEKLRRVWEEVVRSSGLDPAKPASHPPQFPADLEALGNPSVQDLASRPFNADTAVANGSSIAVLAEYEGKRALLCADAFPEVVLEGVDRLLAAERDERLSIEAFKLPHHGSKANLHLPLLERITCAKHLVSTNGTQTRHPNPEAIARIIVGQDDPELCFNYRTDFTEPWDPTKAIIHSLHTWRARFPDPGAEGLVIEL